jgi:hypothetical protein
MPALALGMTLVVLFLGQRWGSSRTVLNEVSVLRAQSGCMTAREEGLIGLFSPTNRAFDLTVEDSAPVLADTGGGDAAGVTDQQVTLGWPNRQEDGLVRWDAVPMQLFSTLVLREERPYDMRGVIEVTPMSANPAAGSTRIMESVALVTNTTPLALTDAYLTFNGRYCPLGALPSGAEVSVAANAWKQGAPKLPAAREQLGELLENTRYRESLNRLWQDASKQLLSDADRRDAWLVARCEGHRGGLRVAEIPYSNRAALVLVRLPGGAR